jgi:hypothetical protein
VKKFQKFKIQKFQDSIIPLWNLGIAALPVIAAPDQVRGDSALHDFVIAGKLRAKRSRKTRNPLIAVNY